MGRKKVIGRHNGWKFLKYSKTHKSTYGFKELSKYQQNKAKEIHTQAYHNKMSQN